MKIYLKFDHSQKNSLKAMNCEYDGGQVNDRILDVVEKYAKDDSLEKTSHLSELIHNELEYEEILFLATHSIQDKMQEVMIKQMKNEIRDILDL